MDKTLALLRHIRLRQECLQVTNALAYHAVVLVTIVISFILSAHLDTFQNVTMVKEGKKHGLVFTKLLTIDINLGGP